MGNVFNIVTVFQAGTGAPDKTDPATIIDYLENYLDITQDQIAKSNKAYRFWADEVALENLNWSQDLLLNSCNSKLHDEAANKLYAAPKETQGKIHPSSLPNNNNTSIQQQQQPCLHFHRRPGLRIF